MESASSSMDRARLNLIQTQITTISVPKFQISLFWGKKKPRLFIIRVVFLLSFHPWAVAFSKSPIFKISGAIITERQLKIKVFTTTQKQMTLHCVRCQDERRVLFSQICTLVLVHSPPIIVGLLLYWQWQQRHVLHMMEMCWGLKLEPILLQRQCSCQLR